LKDQLARNPLIAGLPLESDEEVAAAIARLDKEADAVVRGTASAIFASTAVMQNGRLDALVVFGSQVRMTYGSRRSTTGARRRGRCSTSTATWARTCSWPTTSRTWTSPES
jgi:hypothetical protein